MNTDQLSNLVVGVLKGETTFEDAIDEVAAQHTADEEFPSFVRAMDSHRMEGMGMEEALHAFRERVTALTERDVANGEASEQDLRILLRSFDISADRFRRMVPKARELVAFAEKDAIIPSDEMPDPEAEPKLRDVRGSDIGAF
jgi:hypothetical protein